MKPIIFSTPMVMAILDNRKKQIRRVMKPQPDKLHKYFNGFVTDSTDRSLIGCAMFSVFEDGGCNCQFAKPPYRPGDILWVRETWCTHEDMADVFENQLRPGYYYKANEIGKEWVNDREIVKWRPSIHMPREAARIFLRVTNVRVERVQDITAHDAIREGMESEIPFDTVDEFKELWNNLNAKRGYGWESNPWVWVY